MCIRDRRIGVPEFKNEEEYWKYMEREMGKRKPRKKQGRYKLKSKDFLSFEKGILVLDKYGKIKEVKKPQKLRLSNEDKKKGINSKEMRYLIYKARNSSPQVEGEFLVEVIDGDKVVHLGGDAYDGYTIWSKRRIYDEDGKFLCEIEGDVDLYIVPEGNYIVAIGEVSDYSKETAHISVYNMEGKLLGRYKPKDQLKEYKVISASQDGSYFIVIERYYGKEVILFNKNGNLIWKKEMNIGIAPKVFFSPDNRYILIGGRLMTINGKEKWRTGWGHFEKVYFDPWERFILVIGKWFIYLFGYKTGECVPDILRELKRRYKIKGGRGIDIISAGKDVFLMYKDNYRRTYLFKVLYRKDEKNKFFLVILVVFIIVKNLWAISVEIKGHFGIRALFRKIETG